MKLKKKMFTLVGVIGGALLIVGGISITSMSLLNQATKDISEVWMTSLSLAEGKNTLTSEYRIAQYGHLTSGETKQMDEYEVKLKKLENEIIESSKSYEKLIQTEEDKKLLSEASDLWDLYKAKSVEVINLSKEGNTAAAKKIMLGEARDYYNNFQGRYDQLVDFNKQESEKSKNRAEIIFIIVQIFIITIELIGILLAVLVSGSVIKAITIPVEKIRNMMSEIGKGNLQIRVDYDSKDEFGTLTREVNTFVEELTCIIEDEKYLLGQMADGNFNISTSIEEKYMGDFNPILSSLRKINRNLNGVLSNISETSIQVNAASEQMAAEAQAQALAEGATEQARTVDDLMANVEEVSNQSVASAEKATEVTNMVSDVKEQAENSNKQMEKVVEAMEVITETSVSQTESGNLIVKETAKNLVIVTEKAEKVFVLAEQVKDNSITQRNSMKEVEKGIEVISSVVESNSASAEESSASSQELSANAATLKDMLGRFIFRKED